MQVEIPESRSYRSPDMKVSAYVSETGRLVVWLPDGTWAYLYPHEEVMLWKQSS